MARRGGVQPGHWVNANRGLCGSRDGEKSKQQGKQSSKGTHGASGQVRVWKGLGPEASRTGKVEQRQGELALLLVTQFLASESAITKGVALDSSV
ncbi:hypothetical protein GCM10008949_16100 [Deinococcus humi]|nr:hypothetical protein GCM10008949_16100 [Deinococcus humi]